MMCFEAESSALKCLVEVLFVFLSLEDIKEVKLFPGRSVCKQIIHKMQSKTYMSLQLNETSLILITPANEVCDTVNLIRIEFKVVTLQ